MKKNEVRNDRIIKKRKNYSSNSKSDNSHYNPALIKKQKEFYKNAKNVKKFKKMLKQQTDHSDPSSAQKPMIEMKEDKGESERRMRMTKNSLEELYRKKHEEKERERMEKEATLMAKKKEKEEAQAKRKALRDKMLKKTRRGQPLMKYRIERLLDTIQASQNQTN
ncbi:hypothetical protein PIB30_016654 [Stylosanthes scabra]|uniref:rRNA-processing protein FYV7 n=1 Tax=Stylosanthes scabra TaxID=79078 RepID=A0ABU6W880_9FABA|nr:hypothetical protein [Stylosanthes scabra]